MSKKDLRKVYYTRWASPGTDLKGYFHRFADDYDDDSEGLITYAIIEEDKTGTVEKIAPVNIRFVDDWD